MDNPNALRMRLPEGFSHHRLREAWAGRLEIHRSETRCLTFWDTFEWGVWFGGCLLLSDGNHYRLCTREGGWIGSELSEEEITGAHPRFSRDFKVMKGRLSGLLGLRGLAPLITATFRKRMAELRNETGKIICRIELVEASSGKPSRGASLRYCRILSLRGYEAEASPVAEVLTGLGAEPSYEGLVEILLRNAGITPREYTLRPVFGLSPETPARKAVARIVSTMLSIARSNELGILSDIDTEFLHDYRTCLRKIRSAVSLIKEVYCSEETGRMRSILRDLARKTNRLRDLDVYLLAKEDHLGLLPAAFRPSLDAMFCDFESERSGVLRRISAHLRSASRNRLVEELESFFREEAPHPPSSACDLPVGPLVFRRIYKRYRKIRKLAGGLGPDTPDEVLHELRIQCKKLRYLMEFFAELIPREAAAALEKPLRRLQNRLGALNDGLVQQKSLLAYWEQTQRADGGQTGMALSLGGLVSVLYYRRLEQRDRIRAAIAAFRNAATADLFKRTFRPPIDEPEGTAVL